MKNVLVILLSLILAFGCDDKEKKEDHKDCDCHPIAGEVVAGEEPDQAGEEEPCEGEDCPDCEGEDCDPPQEELDAEVPEEGDAEACDCEGEDCAC